MDSARTKESLAEDVEYATLRRDWIKQRRRRVLDDGPKESTTATEALEKEYEHKDYNNNNGCVGGG